MSLVAIALFAAQGDRRRPRAALVFPLAEAAGHADDVGETEFAERLCGKSAANAAGAIHDDRRLLVEDSRLHLRLEMTARNVDGAVQRTLVVLVGLAHVEHHCPVGNLLLCARGVNLADLRFGGRQQVAESCHA